MHAIEITQVKRKKSGQAWKKTFEKWNRKNVLDVNGCTKILHKNIGSDSKTLTSRTLLIATETIILLLKIFIPRIVVDCKNLIRLCNEKNFIQYWHRTKQTKNFNVIQEPSKKIHIDFNFAEIKFWWKTQWNLETVTNNILSKLGNVENWTKIVRFRNTKFKNGPKL